MTIDYYKLTAEFSDILDHFQSNFLHYIITIYKGKNSVWVLSKKMEDSAEFTKYKNSHEPNDEGFEDMIERWYYGEFISNKVVDSILIKISRKHYEFIFENYELEIFEPQCGSSLSEIEFKEFGHRGRKPTNYIKIS